MSIKGRQMDLKADITSTITFLLYVQVLPRGLQRQLETRFFKFLLGTGQGRLAMHALSKMVALKYPAWTSD